MSEIDDFLDEEVKAKNIASVIMLGVSLLMFISAPMLSSSFYSLSATTLQTTLAIGGVILFLGGVILRLMKIKSAY